MAKVKITLTGTYDLIPAYYPTGLTPHEMMKLDQNNENLGLGELIDSLNSSVDIKWEVIE